jgi:hypothetical protein
VRGRHHALELPARKSRDSRVSWRSVHAAYSDVMREQWFAIRGGKPRRSAAGITRDGGYCQCSPHYRGAIRRRCSGERSGRQRRVGR